MRTNLKYGPAMDLVESGSLATDHMITPGRFLSRVTSSFITDRWCSRLLFEKFSVLKIIFYFGLRMFEYLIEFSNDVKQLYMPFDKNKVE